MRAMSPQLLASLRRTLLSLLFVCQLFGASTLLAADSPWRLIFSLQPALDRDSHLTALTIEPATERYYLVDSGLNRLLSYDRQGNFLKEFRGGQLHRPLDMVRLRNNKLLVVERGRNCLSLIDLASKQVSRHPLHYGQQQVFLDQLEKTADSLYVLDRNSGHILALDEGLQVQHAFVAPEGGGDIRDFVVNGEQLWALAPGWLYGFTRQGRLFKRLSLAGLEIDFPSSLAVSPEGQFFVLDRHLGRISVLDHQGDLLYRFLSSGSGDSFLRLPAELRFDPWGRLVVLDQGHNRVQVLAR